MEDHEQYEALSSRSRRKKLSVSLSCCFNGHHHRSDLLDATSSSIMASPSTRLTPPSSLKGRYKSLISHMSRQRRHSSADFSYDPLSYSRNFEDNDHHHDDPSDLDDFPIRSFASRLPVSPPDTGRATLMASPSSSSSSSWSSSSATKKTIMGPPPMQQRTPCTSSSSRAAAVADVRKSLEEAKPREARPDSWKLEVVRASPNIPTPTPRKVKTRVVVPESRRNIDLLTRAAEVRRGGYEYEYEEVSPALVVSPTSRQVLVELC